MSQRFLPRLSALSVWLGAVLLLVGTLMHPAHADPNHALDAFTEYAADQHWIASHLAQLFGLLLLTIALALLTRLFTNDMAMTLARVGGVCANVGISTAAALQAVDGIALKTMSVYWANAPAAEQPALFAATLGVRQIEIGLASILSMIFGLALVAYGAALLAEHRLPQWFVWIGIVAGLCTTLAGVVMAYTGFSEPAMLINMPANLTLLVWAVGLGIWLWRQRAMFITSG